jgi:hypothetical protein
MLAAGMRQSVGLVTLGTELAFGPRSEVYTNAALPGATFVQFGLAFEARANASVWLSPHWSTGVMLATSLLDRNDVSITLALGVHAFPYDGGR